MSACSASVDIGGGTGATVAKSAMEQQISDQLTKAVGQRPKAVVCPSGMKATKGVTLKCQLEAEDGTEFGVTATIKSTEGRQVRFDIKVDDQPATGS
ncbi:DUF4333 domain-containing protein [Nonomuraea angiospora]